MYSASVSLFWFVYCSLLFLHVFVCFRIKYASHYLCRQYISADFPWKLHDTEIRTTEQRWELCSLLTNSAGFEGFDSMFLFLHSTGQRGLLCQRNPDIQTWSTSLPCNPICTVSSFYSEKGKPFSILKPQAMNNTGLLKTLNCHLREQYFSLKDPFS